MRVLYWLHEQILFDSLIIAGDFNYSNFHADQLSYTTSSYWRALLVKFFYNTMKINDLAIIPDLQLCQSNMTASSIIDYVYVGPIIRQNLKNAQIIRLHQSWSDHSILKVSFTADQAPTGHRMWRANHVYTSHPAQQAKITDKIECLIHRFNHELQLTPKEKWNKVKLWPKKWYGIMGTRVRIGKHRPYDNWKGNENIFWGASLLWL